MDNKRLIKVSKYLSKHLRHQPERLGIVLGDGGWVEVEDLLAACRKNAFAISRAELDEVVAENDKQRFSFDESGRRIRANQGHSIGVDLGLQAVQPPESLYHGTVGNSLSSIQQSGLNKMSRDHVHLSVDLATASRVGARRGRPVILVVRALDMHAQGFEFFVSENGVWLTESVPPQFIDFD